MVAGYGGELEAGAATVIYRVMWALVSGEKGVPEESWLFCGDRCHQVMHAGDRE